MAIDFNEVQKQFPKGAKVRFNPGRGAPEVTGEVLKVRQSGSAGSRGFSIFVDTIDADKKERSVRPNSVHLI